LNPLNKIGFLKSQKPLNVKDLAVKVIKEAYKVSKARIAIFTINELD
jgi:hypothetical protein